MKLVTQPDCDGENSETDTSFDFAFDCCYITSQQHEHLTGLFTVIGKMFGLILHSPTPFLI